MSDQLDFTALRQEAIAHAQAASGNLWTDFNIHDPGVTLMEQYCFALTELGYRAEFPAGDYLAEIDGSIDLKKLGLHQPDGVLPSRPVTAADLGLALTDAAPAARRVMVEPVCAEMAEPGRPDAKRCDRRGLYDIYVVPTRSHGDEEKRNAEALEQVRRAFHANRNLCEDIATLQTAKAVPCILEAEIEVRRRYSPERVAALIFECCGRLLTDGDHTGVVDRVSLRDAFEAPEKLFGHDGTMPEGCQFLDHFFAALSDIDEILNVISLKFVHIDKKTGDQRDPFFDPLPKGHYRHLEFPKTQGACKLTLRSRGLPVHFDVVQMGKELVRTRADRLGNDVVHTDKSEWQRKPAGRYRHFDHLRIGETLPAAYRVGYDVPPYGLSADELSAAAQLRSYLGFSDTPLSGQNADYSALKELFAADSGTGRSYQATVPDYGAAPSKSLTNLDEVTKKIAEFDPWRDRKGRVLDHLLGLYGQAFYQNSLRNHDIYRGPSERQDRVLKNRARFLHAIPELDTNRSGAVDYMRASSCQTSGFGRKLSMLLAFRDRPQTTLTAALDGVKLSILRDRSNDVSEFAFVNREDIAAPDDLLSMLVPRRESFPAIDQSELLSNVLFVKNGTAPARVFRAAANLDSYILNRKADNHWDVCLDIGDKKRLPLVDICRTRDEAVDCANNVAGMFADLNIESWGNVLGNPSHPILITGAFRLVNTGQKVRAMENNFPINEDLAYEKIRDLMFDMMEEDPNRFYALTDKLNELAALPKRTMTLVLDLMAATPFQVIIPKHVRKNDPDTFKADHETVSNVLFLGEFGGIAVELEPNEALREPRIISITMVEIPHRNPLRKRVNEYRKKRIKKLRKNSVE